MALVVRWVHVLSAMTWIGGMLFIALVLVPAARGLGDASLRTRLVQEIGRRFRTIAWMVLALLVMTGLLNLWMAPALFRSPRFHWNSGSWSSP